MVVLSFKKEKKLHQKYKKVIHKSAMVWTLHKIEKKDPFEIICIVGLLSKVIALDKSHLVLH